MSVMYVTKETLEQMKAELHRMKTVERPAASKAIAEAREKGDLKENAEYDAAREAQALLEVRISKMEEIIAHARIVDETKLDLTKASILTTVKIKNLKNKSQMSYTLVAENEADLKAGKISVDSPIGKALLGKRVGDQVTVQVPAGILELEVVSISL